MSKKLIYDLPTRVFHWSFAGLFILAFMIAKTVDDESPTFSYHMLAGFMLGGLVVLRIIWGVVGSHYAHFRSFALRPSDLIGYLKGILTGDKRRWTGHNPGSSWAALAMMGSAVMLAVTGYLMTSGLKEEFEDAHELFANAFLVTVLLHIAGVIIHGLRQQDGLALSMIHGKKADVDKQAEITGQRPVIALLFIILLSGFGSYLYKNYNSNNQELTLFGKTLQLGEEEND